MGISCNRKLPVRQVANSTVCGRRNRCLGDFIFRTHRVGHSQLGVTFPFLPLGRTAGPLESTLGKPRRSSSPVSQEGSFESTCITRSFLNEAQRIFPGIFHVKRALAPRPYYNAATRCVMYGFARQAPERLRAIEDRFQILYGEVKRLRCNMRFAY